MKLRSIAVSTTSLLVLVLVSGCEGGDSNAAAMSGSVIVPAAALGSDSISAIEADPGPDSTPIVDEPSTAINDDTPTLVETVRPMLAASNAGGPDVPTSDPTTVAPGSPTASLSTASLSAAPQDYTYAAAPTMKMDAATFDPAAKQVHVRVYLTSPPPTTVIARIKTKNGSGPNYMYSGGNYVATTKTLIFRPGDPLEQTVTIPITKAKEGGHFVAYVPSVPSGASRGTSSVNITAAKGAKNTAITWSGRAPRTFKTGRAPSYNLDMSQMRWSNAGGAGVWETKLPHGRAQPANAETGLYLDPQLHPTADAPFRIENGQLVIRSQRLSSPIYYAGLGNGTGKGTYMYGSAILTGAKNPETHIRHGQIEWQAKMPDRRGSWPALWLVSTKGWPPEIDVYEGFNYNNSFDPVQMASGTIHGGPSGKRNYARGYSENVVSTYGIAPTLTTDFHSFAVDIQPDYITWFIDGVEVFQATNKFNAEFYPLMNVAVKTNTAYQAGSGDMVVRSFKVWRQ
ncbi:glycoside hydrolase family 16 protein [Sphingomonas qomolangmaensis]|uniref:Glycoside hydrolase family 16 protein n=1 Tax=Sphingomonas qomolangmaensis TaxID=2918765 RepID=A0ABY5L961_9SPHN|nr:family 16 glycosylhydrolase [Sphingomonas qomolangmaensis]UUL82397.1 glycoside hydrolase family 16 protein [Sphingomonas qomolangmaensis]